MTFAEWLGKRQTEYDKRMAEAGAGRFERTSLNMMSLHECVVKEIDDLPYEQGGKEK